MKRRHLITLPLVGLLPRHLLAQTRDNIAAKKRPDAPYYLYPTQKLAQLPGFSMQQADPPRNGFGGWNTNHGGRATGKYRTEKQNGRWWLIDPSGNRCLHIGVVSLYNSETPGSRAAYQKKYRSLADWANQTTDELRANGFNGAGCWSSITEIRAAHHRFSYCAYIEPMGKFRDALKAQGDFQGKVGWQGYPNDIIRVFDPRFDAHIEAEAKKLAQYANAPYCVGYFTDNELPWKNDALDRILTHYRAPDPGYLAAKKWLNLRKGSSATLADINDADRQAFTAYYIETYLQKVTRATRKYAPGKLYLGCRFNQHKEELANEALMRAAGKYMDIISINHYHKWQPDTWQMQQWENWSGKPFLISEFYSKGEDSGLANETGEGWIVKTQEDRGYFYQNFIIELLKSRACVGWHWLSYQDSDPTYSGNTSSNRNTNKGLYTYDYRPYDAALKPMQEINNRLYRLIEYLDRS